MILTIVLVNSMLASADMPCEMDSQNSGIVQVSETESQMDHSQHNMAAMAMNLVDMNTMAASGADCCDSNCLCEMGCSAYIVLLESDPNQKILHTDIDVIFYIDTILNARQRKIYHPPILA